MDIIHPLTGIIEFQEHDGRLLIQVQPDIDKKSLFAQISQAIDKGGVLNADLIAIRAAIREGAGEFRDIGPVFEQYHTACNAGIEVSCIPLKCSITVSSSLVKEEGVRLTVGQLKQRLLNESVTFGINEQALANIVAKELWNVSVVVAEGVPPVNGENGLIEYLKTADAVRAPKIDDDDRADFREMQIFTEVKAGDVIARRIAEGQGTPGTSVRAEPIPAVPGVASYLRGGLNLTIAPDGNELTADVNGVLENHNGLLMIKPQLEIHGDVDFNVGNIMFSENIIIHGDVTSGFKVQSDKDITIHGQIEACTIISTGGTVTITKGVIGKNSTVIRGKEVVLAYAQDAEIHAEGLVKVDSMLRHCFVTCADLETVTRSASITGGEVTALNSIKIASAGNDEEIPTKLMIIDKASFELGAKKKQLTEVLNQLNERYVTTERAIRGEVARIKIAGSMVTPEIIANHQQLVQKFEQIKEKTKVVEGSIASILEEMKAPKPETGGIIVKGTLFKGTVLEIYRKAKSITTNLESTHFFSRDGEIVSKSIG